MFPLIDRVFNRTSTNATSTQKEIAGSYEALHDLHDLSLNKAG